LEPVKVKGISAAVRIFEVPWRQPETPAPASAQIAAAPTTPVPPAPAPTEAAKA
jgi:hypothetical protein